MSTAAAPEALEKAPNRHHFSQEVTRLTSQVVRRIRGKSRPATVPDDQYMDRLASVEFRPVFLVADHRSGTTMASELFARTKCFNYVNAYHVMHEDRLLANHIEGVEEQACQEIDEQCEKMGITTRGMDKIAAGADTAVDYVSFLSTATGSGILTDATVGPFEEFCKKVQYISEPGKPLILKSCPDYRNFLYIKSRFPQAKFVFLFRDPIRLLDSQLRIFQKSNGNRLLAVMSEDYRRFEQSWLFPLIRKAFSPTLGVNPGYKWLVRRMKRAEKQLFDDLPHLPESEYVMLRYEDLMTDADGEMHRILDFLNLTPPEPFHLQEWIEPRNLPLLPQIENDRPRLEAMFRRTREFLGYTDSAARA